MRLRVKLVLASGSPRRKELMESAGLTFTVRPTAIEEINEGSSVHIAVENSRLKAHSAVIGKEELIIGADTVVECCGEILGKPVDIDDARRMINLQLGSRVKVITGLTVIDTSKDIELYGHEISLLEMKGDQKDIEEYLAKDLWKGKAGAFGIQDESGLDIDLLQGEMDNVVGMPLTLLGRILALARYGS